MEDAGKGTVTSLASLFPAGEAQKAAKRVQDAIAEKEKELGRLQGFIADNNNLISLVQRLPEELHHDIMVLSHNQPNFEPVTVLFFFLLASERSF